MAGCGEMFGVERRRLVAERGMRPRRVVVLDPAFGLSEPLRLSEKNTSAGFRDQGLDSTMANRIYDLYRADFDTFGYDPTTWRFYEKVGSGRGSISAGTEAWRPRRG
jgi:hypothetical protein